GRLPWARLGDELIPEKKVPRITSEIVNSQPQSQPSTIGFPPQRKFRVTGLFIAEYRRNIARVELLHCRELLLQSDQLIAKAKIFCVPSAVLGRAGLLDLALMKRTPRAQMG